MGLLNFLGLDEIADSVREFTDEFDALKQDVIDSVIAPGEELKNTVDDIAGSITNGAPTEAPEE